MVWRPQDHLDRVVLEVVHNEVALVALDVGDALDLVRLQEDGALHWGPLADFVEQQAQVLDLG